MAVLVTSDGYQKHMSPEGAMNMAYDPDVRIVKLRGNELSTIWDVAVTTKEETIRYTIHTIRYEWAHSEFARAAKRHAREK